MLKYFVLVYNISIFTLIIKTNKTDIMEKFIEYITNVKNIKDPKWVAFHLADSALLVITIVNLYK